MKRYYLAIMLSVGGLFTILSLLSCSDKGVSGLGQVYNMREYFPLALGNNWTYDMTVVLDYDGEDYWDGDIYLGEPFRDVDGDGVYNPFEPFTDLNGNGRWDQGEPYQDLNGNGQYDPVFDSFISCTCPDNNDLNHNGRYDGPNEPMPPDMPFIDGVTVLDLNRDGDFDPPNGRYDWGEPFADQNGNGVYDQVIKAQTKMKLEIDTSVILANGEEIFYRRFTYYLSFGNTPIYQYLLTNDQNGLRWWGYKDKTSSRDYLAEVEPLILAPAELKLGDVEKNKRLIAVDESTTVTAELTSIFIGLEDISTPAGRFRDCLKFVHLTTSWPKEMSQFNGTTYQWYARGVGLVKQTGPAATDYWELQSALVNGESYP